MHVEKSCLFKVYVQGSNGSEEGQHVRGKILTFRANDFTGVKQGRSQETSVSSLVNSISSLTRFAFYTSFNTSYAVSCFLVIVRLYFILLQGLN